MQTIEFHTSTSKGLLVSPRIVKSETLPGLKSPRCNVDGSPGWPTNSIAFELRFVQLTTYSTSLSDEQMNIHGGEYRFYSEATLVGPPSIENVKVSKFESDEVECIREITIQLQRIGGGIIADYPEANIASGGVDRPEAIASLKSLILDFYFSFRDNPDEKLGPFPKKQREILNSLFITKRNAQKA